MRLLDDIHVVKEFVAYLAVNGHPGLKIDSRPECANDNDIDAIAGPFAIEHTSIDTLPNQRRNNARFMKVLGDLEQELNPLPLKFNLFVSIEYDAITKGQDWSAIKQALRRWILEESPCLKDGPHVLNNNPGIPFSIHVNKEATDSPGRLSFSRFDPNDNTLPCRIKKLFDRKAKKLAKYQGCGKTTILLIESYDSALMYESKLVTAIRDAYPNGLPSGVDTFWYAPNTSIVAPIKFKDITADLLAEDYPTKISLWEEIEKESKKRQSGLNLQS